MSVPCHLRYARLTALRQLVASASINCWLSPAERSMYSRWRHPRRRESYLTGRVLAKQLIVERLRANSDMPAETPFCQIDIHSGQTHGLGERPQFTVHGRKSLWSLSIAHNERGVLAALADRSDINVGVDLVAAAQFARSFARYWFTQRELQWAQRPSAPNRLAAVWAMKEAVYKACNSGEGFAPRAIEIRQDAHGSVSSFCSSAASGEPCRVTTRTIDGQLTALAWLNRSEDNRPTASRYAGTIH